MLVPWTLNHRIEHKKKNPTIKSGARENFKKFPNSQNTFFQWGEGLSSPTSLYLPHSLPQLNALVPHFGRKISCWIYCWIPEIIDFSSYVSASKLFFLASHEQGRDGEGKKGLRELKRRVWWCWCWNGADGREKKNVNSNWFVSFAENYWWFNVFF